MKKSTAFAALAVVLATAVPAAAQVGGGSSSGLFGGSRNVGGASGTTAGTRTFGGTQGLGAQGGGGFGQGGVGGTVAGATQQDLQAGTITGSERFMRGNTSFIGNDSQDVGNTLGILGGQQAGGAGLRNFAAILSQQQQQQTQGGNNGGQNAIPFRISRVIAFATPEFSPDAGANPRVSAALSQRLSRMSQGRLGSSVQAEMLGRTVILKGTVANSYDRDLLAQVALLEPGVAAVDNQIEVGPVEDQPAGP
jgi:hypothetical protein